MFTLVKSIALDAFCFLDSVYKNSVFPLPAISALKNTWVYVYSINGNDVSSDIKTPIS